MKDLLSHFGGLSSYLAVRQLDIVQALLQYASLVLTRLRPHAQQSVAVSSHAIDCCQNMLVKAHTLQIRADSPIRRADDPQPPKC